MPNDPQPLSHEYTLLQLIPSEVRAVSEQFANKRRVHLESDSGVMVHLTFQPSTSSVKVTLKVLFEQQKSALEESVTKLINQYRSLSCKTSIALEEDPARNFTKYSFGRFPEIGKPIQVTFEFKGTNVSALLNLQHHVPDLKEKLDDPSIFLGIFTGLSKEFSFLRDALATKDGAQILPANLQFKMSESLSYSQLPIAISEGTSLELPRHSLNDVIGQEHVVRKIRNGLTRIQRQLEFEMPEDASPEIKRKLELLKKLMTIPTGYVFTGPSGVGKNYTFEAFQNELQRILVDLKPEKSLLVESISPNTIRSKWWGDDERAIATLFTKLRAAVAETGFALLFIDEADTLLQDAENGGHQSSITNQFKIELNNSQGIILILNSNHPDKIDPSIINRVGVENQLEFNFLDGGNVVSIIERRFKASSPIFSPNFHSIDFSILRDNKTISLINEMTGRQVKQALDELIAKIADQEQYLLIGIPVGEIPNYLKVDTKCIERLILGLKES